MENILSKDSWRLEHSSKIDILEEPAHTHLIHKFILDEETSIERSEDNTYILSGNEEALLVIPKRTTTRLLLFWCWITKRLSIQDNLIQ